MAEGAPPKRGLTRRGLLIGGAVVVVAVLGLWALWPSPPQASTQAPTQVPAPEPAATAAPINNASG